MKRCINTAVVAGVLCAVPYVQANEDKKDPNKQRDQGDVTAAQNHQRGHSARSLIGQDVHDRTGERLGELNDVVVDTKSGKAVYAVVGSGGVLGVGEKLRAVPISLLSQKSGNELMLDVDQTKWSTAPMFARDELAALGEDQRQKELRNHYGAKSSIMDSMRKSDGATLAFATDLVGKDLVKGTQAVGDVEDVIVNLDSRKASALIDPNDDFTGTDAKFVVSFDRISRNTGDREKLSTELDRSDFQAAAPVDNTYWNNDTPNTYIYRWHAFGYPYAGDAAGLDTALREDAARSDGQMRRGVNTLERQSAEMVKNALRSDASLKEAAQNVDVVRQGDNLVLRGTVETDEMKNRIEDRAEEIARDIDIENQITVATGE